jgi:hypothetical protein
MEDANEHGNGNDNGHETISAPTADITVYYNPCWNQTAAVACSFALLKPGEFTLGVNGTATYGGYTIAVTSIDSDSATFSVKQAE